MEQVHPLSLGMAQAILDFLARMPINKAFSNRKFAMFNSVSARAANAYRRVGIETTVDGASPHRLISLLFDSLTEEPLGEAAYNELSGIFIPAAIDMVSNERLFEEYDRRAVKVDGKWLNLLVRKDASSVLAETLPGPP